MKVHILLFREEDLEKIKYLKDEVFRPPFKPIKDKLIELSKRLEAEKIPHVLILGADIGTANAQEEVLEPAVEEYVDWYLSVRDDVRDKLGGKAGWTWFPATDDEIDPPEEVDFTPQLAVLGIFTPIAVALGLWIYNALTQSA